MACPNCRYRLPLGAKFCDSCGSRLTSYTSPTATERHQEGSESGSEREPEPLPTSFGGGRYEVRQFLGAGATKKVYLVHDTVLDRDVAFALIRAPGMDESDLRRILREAQTMARLGDHPNIVSIYEYGEEGGAPFMVLPMMAGGSVQHLIATAAGKKPKIETVLRIATDVCKGLEFAHSNGVVHRDVKPGNLWLTADGVAKIGDFGIALSPTHSRMTNSGVILGTVAYIAPEQATGAAVDERSDLYSFGAVLYELVSGRPPFTGEHPVAIIGQHINTMAVAPSRYNPKCPSRLEGLILQLLAKEPVDRLKSASEVLAVLASTSEADKARKGKPGRGKSRKTPLQVLIAEDSEDDSMLLLRELRKGGFDPTHKRVDTPAAMKSALENGTWDVIIADYSMPQFTAPAALKLMQDSGLDIPFIIMSGTVSEETAVAAMKAGANDYVMKNNLARIVPAVERELAEAEERRERRRAEQEGTQLHRQLEERQGRPREASGEPHGAERPTAESDGPVLRADQGIWPRV